MYRDIAGHEELTGKIIECGIRVHEIFGPGLLESVYRPCLTLELRDAGLQVDTTRRVPLVYKSLKLETFYCPDIIVNDVVIVELKAVESLTALHSAQLLTYLKLSQKRVGLLINFNVRLLKDGGIVRRVL